MEKENKEKLKALLEKPLLEQIIGNLVIYLHPEYLLEPYASKVKENPIKDISLLKKYWELLTTINNVSKRILKYNVYFSEFYPTTDKISDHEALKYHVFSYLEDMTILKNKINTFLGTLKNDLKKVAINRDQIDKLFVFLIQEVEKVFKKVLDERNPHHHRGWEFIVGNLHFSETSDVFLNDENAKSFLSKEGIEMLEKHGKDAFEKTKKEYINLANKNNEQTEGLLNDISKRTKNFLYDLIGIKPIY